LTKKKSDSAYIFKASPKHEFSEYQKNIFRDIAKGTGHTLVIARAGSSKTYVLVEGSKFIPRGKRSLFCAFNKHIQEELRSRLGSYVECFTLHSLGLRAIKLRFGNVEVDYNKCWKLIATFIDEKKDIPLIINLCKAVSLCKATLSDIPSQIEEIICAYDIDLCETPVEEFIKYVIKALRLCKEQTNAVDFDDMVWLCFVYRINVGKYDYVLIDEAQDLNKAQIELALSAVKPDGRVMAVLDNFQAIYSWRGAHPDILELFRERLKPKELPLPICYRCPKKIVQLAQTLVPDIQPYEKAIEGEIINITLNDLQKYAKPGSYVISRYNAPLIKSCFSFLKSGIPANILGRDIGDNLSSLVRKSKKKTIESFRAWIIKWEKKEKENLLAKYPRASTDTIADKAECLHILCDDADTMEELKDNIDNLFKDGDEKGVVLHSSIHKIKGKETDDVFVLADTLRDFSQEENNIKYIGFTRAKKKLYLVSKVLEKEEL